jgi:hypothetical protein
MRCGCYAGANVNLLIISRLPYSANIFENLAVSIPEPVQVHFAGYKDEVVRKVGSTVAT